MPIKDSKIIKNLFNSELFQKEYQLGDHIIENSAPLPDSSLEFLLKVSQLIGAKKVFEFGSGRSTQAFLNEGLEVTSIEDSSYWMEEIRKSLSQDLKVKHKPIIKPLSLIWRNAAPFYDWFLDQKIIDELKQADLILIDSPLFKPFRESTLYSVLSLTKNTLVVLDDTRIKTLKRFCDRLASNNKFLLHAHVKVGHEFDFFTLFDNDLPLNTSCSLIDTLKAWRRFFMWKTIENLYLKT